MIRAIQQAYYREARNPSDTDTLCALAQQIGLDADSFAVALHADATRQALLADINFARSIGGNSFPALILQHNVTIRPVQYDYNDAAPAIQAINAALLV